MPYEATLYDYGIFGIMLFGFFSLVAALRYLQSQTRESSKATNELISDMMKTMKDTTTGEQKIEEQREGNLTQFLALFGTLVSENSNVVREQTAAIRRIADKQELAHAETQRIVRDGLENLTEKISSRGESFAAILAEIKLHVISSNDAVAKLSQTITNDRGSTDKLGVIIENIEQQNQTILSILGKIPVTATEAGQTEIAEAA